MSRPMPPSGANPPLQTRTAAGDPIDLVALAQDICRRYSSEFPDEQERYGPAGHAWCLHDNQYLLAWAIQDARDHTVDLAEQVVWLADVLNARGFPIARLAPDLEIAAEVVTNGVDDAPLARHAASKLTAVAATLRHPR
jgi:hypothetical protein